MTNDCSLLLESVMHHTASPSNVWGCSFPKIFSGPYVTAVHLSAAQTWCMCVWKRRCSSILTVVWPRLQLLMASRYSSLPGSDTVGGRPLWPCRSRPCLQVTDTIFLFSVLQQQQQQQHWLNAAHSVCRRGGHWWSGHQMEEKHWKSMKRDILGLHALRGCDKLDADTCSLWNNLHCIFWQVPEMFCSFGIWKHYASSHKKKTSSNGTTRNAEHVHTGTNLMTGLQGTVQ